MTGHTRPDYVFKLSEEPGLLTIEQIIRRKVEEEFCDIETRMAEVFDTKNGKYAQQYESIGKIRVEDAIRKYG